MQNLYNCETKEYEQLFIPQMSSPKQVDKDDWRPPQGIFKVPQNNSSGSSWQCLIPKQGWRSWESAEGNEVLRAWGGHWVDLRSTPTSIAESYTRLGAPGWVGRCWYRKLVSSYSGFIPSAADEQSKTFSPEVVIHFSWYFGSLRGKKWLIDPLQLCIVLSSLFCSLNRS